MVNGQPVVFLYSASFAVKHDQTCIDFARQSFARDFGGRVPYIVREVSWQVKADNVYAWGGATGLKNPGVATLGPGYNDSAVLGRTPLIVDRDGGAFFERNWIKFLRNPSPMVVVETWNEYHEGTDVAASREYGRTYLELNRKYADMFKRRVRPPMPRGRYTDVKFVSAALRAVNLEEGLDQFEGADGATISTNVAGSDCRAIAQTVYSGRYIYFRVDDSFKWAPRMAVDIEVEYFDSAGGSFTIEFDGSDLSAPFQGAYTSSNLTVPLTGSRFWRTAKFKLAGARFLNSQNGGADFRIAVSGHEFYVRRVKVIRPGLPDEAGQILHGFLGDFNGARNTNWVAAGPRSDLFQAADGLLKVHSASEGANYLLLASNGGNAGPQEILARVRITRLGNGVSTLGGLAIAVNTNDHTGLNYSFQVTDQGVRQTGLSDELLGPGPKCDFAWAVNTWYWVRLRHEPSSLTGFPDVWAKTWLADGNTAEPPGWLCIWNYYPGQPARAGFAGIVAGSDNGSAGMESDFFLLKAGDLPEIRVVLPALKPSVSTLSRGRRLVSGEFQFQITGDAGLVYRIDASTNLVDWTESGGVVITNGISQFIDSTAMRFSQRFYRVQTTP